MLTHPEPVTAADLAEQGMPYARHLERLRLLTRDLYDAVNRDELAAQAWDDHLMDVGRSAWQLRRIAEQRQELRWSCSTGAGCGSCPGCVYLNDQWMWEQARPGWQHPQPAHRAAMREGMRVVRTWLDKDAGNE